MGFLDDINPFKHNDENNNDNNQDQNNTDQTSTTDSTAVQTPAATETPVPAETSAPAETPAPTETTAPTDAAVTDTVSDDSETTDGVYVVQDGDTLGEIAEANGTDVDTLVAINGIDDPSMIYPGQEIKLS